MSAPKKAKVEETEGPGHAAAEEAAPAEAADLGADGNQEDQPYEGYDEDEVAVIADQAAEDEAHDVLEALQRQLLDVSSLAGLSGHNFSSFS